MSQEPTPASGNRSEQRKAPPGTLPEEVFAQRIKERREELGYTQGAVAANLFLMSDVALDATGLTRIERGERRIRLNEAVALCTLLGLDLHEATAAWPGDLSDQLERAEVARLRAEYAAEFWFKEAEAAAARHLALAEQWRIQLDARKAEEAAWQNTVREHVDRGEE